MRRILPTSVLWQGLVLAVLSLRLALPAAGEDEVPVDAVKAIFLYRFAAYVDWPAPALEKGRFTIAVLGADPVAEELDRLLQTRTIKNLPAKVRKVEDQKEAVGAQIVFIGAAYAGDLRTLIDALERRPVLVVTDREQALDDGSMVNFLLVDRHVRFEISLPATERAGLKLSPGLLAVAANVRGAPHSDLGCQPWQLPPFGETRCALQVAQP